MLITYANQSIKLLGSQIYKKIAFRVSAKQLSNKAFIVALYPKYYTASLLDHHTFGIPKYCTSQSRLYCSQVDSVATEDQLALAKLEYESCKLDGVLEIPTTLTNCHWEELALLSSTYKKRKYLRFLFLTEMKKINNKNKGKLKREYSTKRRDQTLIEKQVYSEGNRHIVYGLWNNSYLMKFGDSRMKRSYNYTVMLAMLRGQHLIFDAGYTSMNSAEEKRAGDQFSMGFSHNRLSKDPFYIHLCNYNYNSSIHKKLTKVIPTVHDKDFPLDIHEDSYLNHFPKEQLVYLTPHCNTEMLKFDHNAVYIVGYLVDTRESDPLSLAKAKKENIKMRKLPLDRYLDWGKGQKSLTLDQMLGIMVEVKDTGSWVKAFEKYIPKRKLKRPEEITAKDIKKKMEKEKFERFKKYKIDGIKINSLFQE